jgi:hypothetical protein
MGYTGDDAAVPLSRAVRAGPSEEQIPMTPPVAGGGVPLYGTIPTEHPGESAQFHRILSALSQNASLLGHWACALLNFDYSHLAGTRIDNDVDWNGQFDIVLLSQNRIIIYELKAMRVRILQGRSDASRWHMEYVEGGRFTERSYFDQASKQRAFFLREYLSDFVKRHNVPEPNHYVVDSRLIFFPGSDVSGFHHKVQSTTTPEALASEILPRITDPSEAAFVRDAFVVPIAHSGELKRRRMTPGDQQRLEDIWSRYNIRHKTAKWFSIITEDQIPADLAQPGFPEFDLRPDDAATIAAEFGLATSA